MDKSSSDKLSSNPSEDKQSVITVEAIRKMFEILKEPAATEFYWIWYSMQDPLAIFNEFGAPILKNDMDS